MIATGSDFIDAPLAVAYWTALEAAVVVILLAARAGPMWRAATAAGAPHPATVAVGALVIATYLFGTVRLSPSPQATPAVAVRTPHPTAAAPSRAVASPSPAAPIGATVSDALGEVVDTPYGGAQVRVVLSGGRVIDVEPVLLPSMTRRSWTISNSAEQWLRKRAIAAQSAEFDVLSGATYTSRAYMASLDSALHAAGVDAP